MKHWILLLAPILLLITVPDGQAHDVISVNGNSQDHQHVYRRQQYGKPLQQGHLLQAPGGNSTIIWGSGTQSDYGKSTIRRSGPIIDDQEPDPSTRHKGSKRKFGSEVHGYGKPARNR